jgi:hypothetical protein
MDRLYARLIYDGLAGRRELCVIEQPGGGREISRACGNAPSY